jgi:hypothetical protein
VFSLLILPYCYFCCFPHVKTFTFLLTRFIHKILAIRVINHITEIQSKLPALSSWLTMFSCNRWFSLWASLWSALFLHKKGSLPSSSSWTKRRSYDRKRYVTEPVELTFRRKSRSTNQIPEFLQIFKLELLMNLLEKCKNVMNHTSFREWRSSQLVLLTSAKAEYRLWP